MSPRHKAPVVVVARHVRFRRAQQFSWILLGMLFVAAVLLSSPQLGGAYQQDPEPARDLGAVSHAP
jgi:hypothetical protein